MWWSGGMCCGCESALAVGEVWPWCPACGCAAEPSQRWLDVDGLAVAAGWLYAGPLQGWIAKGKSGEFRQPRPLLSPLATLIAASAQSGPLMLVSIAPHLGRLRERGMHLPDLLAAGLARRDRPHTLCLRRMDQRDVRRQSREAAPEFVATAPVRGCNRVVLIDDVVTTGATLLAARTALESVGWKVAAAVCLADARPAVLGCQGENHDSPAQAPPATATAAAIRIPAAT